MNSFGSIVDVLSMVGTNDSLLAGRGRFNMLLIVGVLEILLVLDNGSSGLVVQR